MKAITGRVSPADSHSSTPKKNVVLSWYLGVAIGGSYAGTRQQPGKH